jgi:hypothetical protein
MFDPARGRLYFIENRRLVKNILTINAENGTLAFLTPEARENAVMPTAPADGAVPQENEELFVQSAVRDAIINIGLYVS